MGILYIQTSNGMKVVDPSTPYGKEEYDRILEEEYPELWKICYPRHYREPRNCGQFFSPKIPARKMLDTTVKIMGGRYGNCELYEFVSMSHLAKFGVPMYWIGKEIGEALLRTAPPGKFDWYNMPLPFPACVFHLPKGLLTHPTDGDVAYLMYCRLRAGETHISKLVPGKPYALVNGGITMFAGLADGTLTHWNMPLDAYGPYLSIPDISSLMEQYKGNVHTTGFWMDKNLEMTPEDDELGSKVMHLIFSTLFLMAERPELVSFGQLEKKVRGKNGRPDKEFWSPHVIGERYRIRREPTHGGGTHASPRFHWVRGAWKQQPYGPELSLRKTIWVEPYTRG